MSDDLKAVLGWAGGLILAGLSAITGWLIKTTLTNREDVITLKGATLKLEGDMADFKKSQVTTEGVRSVIEDILEKRDKAAELRRKEWDRLHKLEIKEAVSESLEKLTPKIIHEVSRAATGKHRLPTPSEESRVKPGEAS